MADTKQLLRLRIAEMGARRTGNVKDLPKIISMANSLQNSKNVGPNIDPNVMASVVESIQENVSGTGGAKEQCAKLRQLLVALPEDQRAEALQIVERMVGPTRVSTLKQLLQLPKKKKKKKNKKRNMPNHTTSPEVPVTDPVSPTSDIPPPAVPEIILDHGVERFSLQSLG
jgi:hypothetical protein